MDTIQSNKTIALFMGWKEDEIQAEDWCGCNVLDDVFSGLKEMRHYAPNERWDDLMPVVEKIRNIGLMVHIEFYDEECVCQIGTDVSQLLAKFSGSNEGNTIPMIMAVYSPVLELINWYNSQTH